MRAARLLAFATLPSIVAGCAVGNSSDRSDFGATAGSAGAGGGTAGASGQAGSAGAAGKAGAGQAGAGGAGQSGAGGAAGAGGASGASGASGGAGASGASGVAGAAGASGQGGDAGTAGASGQGGGGAAGQAGGGQAGASGGAGASGASGVAGAAGASGQGGGGAAGQAGGGQAGASGGGGITGVAGAGGFATCATGESKGEIKVRPVDIIWVVDNSSSMSQEVASVNAGINAFAASIDQKGLDYRVVMLSLRGKGQVTAGGVSNKWGVCVPQPLAGDADCGNGARFFHAPCDIRSTQPLEQFLGTLGQTKGYDVTEAPQATGDHRGSEPWKQHLRPDSTKSIVVVTDDSSRLSSDDFLHFKGGPNPNNKSFDLPPGILDPSWGGLFDSWVFHAIYGWGSDTDPTVLCPTASKPTMASWFLNYTNLVQLSGGARAKVCDGASAWGPFFDAISKSVVDTSKISCEIPVPPPPNGQTEINPDKVNVVFVSGTTETALGRADLSGTADCSKGGWHYDDPKAPTKIILCPTTCADANSVVGAGKPGEVKVLFGCNSVKP